MDYVIYSIGLRTMKTPGYPHQTLLLRYMAGGYVGNHALFVEKIDLKISMPIYGQTGNRHFARTVVLAWTEELMMLDSGMTHMLMLCGGQWVYCDCNCRECNRYKDVVFSNKTDNEDRGQIDGQNGTKCMSVVRN